MGGIDGVRMGHGHGWDRLGSSCAEDDPSPTQCLQQNWRDNLFHCRGFWAPVFACANFPVCKHVLFFFHNSL